MNKVYFPLSVRTHRYKLKALEFAGGSFAESGSDPLTIVPGNGTVEFRPNNQIFFAPDDELEDSVITAFYMTSICTELVPSLTVPSHGPVCINDKDYYPIGQYEVYPAVSGNESPYTPVINQTNQVTITLRDKKQKSFWTNIPVNDIATDLVAPGQVKYKDLGIPGPAYPFIPNTSDYALRPESAIGAYKNVGISSPLNYNQQKQRCLLKGVDLKQSYIQVNNKPEPYTGGVGNTYLTGINGTALFFGIEFLHRTEWNNFMTEAGFSEMIWSR